MPSKSLPPFPQAAKTALGNSQLRRNLGKATASIRAKRDSVVSELPDWEALRAAGSAIKAHVMHHLDEYLLQLEAAVQRTGGQVHWARDAAEANRIVTEIVQGTGANSVVKVKSLTKLSVRGCKKVTRSAVAALKSQNPKLIVEGP